MKITPTQQNFYGYKNIISDDIRGRNCAITFITAQLDDEGSKDLSEFKNLKEMFELPSERVNNDVITMMYTQFDGNKPNLFIDDRVLFWGDELKWLKDNRPKAMPIEEYKNIEAIHMKAYTLMANLTKRISERVLPLSDSGISNTISSFMRVMTEFTKNDDASFDILQHSFSSKVPTQRIAEDLNAIFCKTMKKFFM